MNTSMWHLPKRDIVVLILCAVSLVSTLGAVGEGGRRRAKEMVCQSNLYRWSGVFRDHIERNNGEFFSGQKGTPGYWWVKELDDEHKDWKRMRIWFCPQAVEPIQDEQGRMEPTPNIFNAWGICSAPGLGPSGVSGSYSVNGYKSLQDKGMETKGIELTSFLLQRPRFPRR